MSSNLTASASTWWSLAIATVCACSLAAGAAIAEQNDALVASARPAIDRANAEWAEAIKHGDTATIVKPYAADAVFVMADGRSIQGRQAIRELYASRAAAYAGIESAEIAVTGTADVGSGMVIEWGQGTIAVKRTDGSVATRSGPYLTVWRRSAEGDWQIIRNLTF